MGDTGGGLCSSRVSLRIGNRVLCSRNRISSSIIDIIDMNRRMDMLKVSKVGTCRSDQWKVHGGQ